MKYTVTVSKLADKQMTKIPEHILSRLKSWIETVEQFGLIYARTLKSLHDEPLQGKRKGQRSIRLNKQWRLIYSENETTQQIEILILEVTPHDYRIR
jgi:proteic killer suppression protein